MNSVLLQTKYFSHLGPIKIIEQNHRILSISLLSKTSNSFKKQDSSDTSPLLHQAKKELTEYFSNKRKTFKLPLKPPDSDWVRQVWQALQTIPYGQLCSYSELAQKIGCPQSVRAVGTACGQNPHLIIVPCHRVTRKNKQLGGFSAGLEAKKNLLKQEGHNFT